LNRAPIRKTTSAFCNAKVRAAATESGWSSGITPLPIGERTNGICVRSRKERSRQVRTASSARDQAMPLPTRTSGRSAAVCYILPRMAYEIILAPEAVEDLRSLKANIRATVRRALETHLRHQPEKASRSRIKRLRGLRQPQYRLRVGEARVFYDVSGSTVEILAIVTKSGAEAWLGQFGRPV
jgi:mRNA interferase RelE/StbE